MKWTPGERRAIYEGCKLLIAADHKKGICGGLWLSTFELFSDILINNKFFFQQLPEFMTLTERVTKEQLRDNHGWWYPLTPEYQTQRLKDLDEMISLIP